jgi:putative IMPACT (imprinted ancient) family translation regulator
MLAVLKGSGLTNVIITAARWFGGTKLGTGGLVKAYGDCARLALENAQAGELVPMSRFGMVIPYNFYDQAKRLFESCAFTVLAEEFGAAVTVQGEIPESDAASLKAALSELTCSKCRFLAEI